MRRDVTKLSYTLTEAAEAVGVSKRALQAAHANGDLEFHYPTSHPVVLHDDLLAWVACSPTTAVRRSA